MLTGEAEGTAEVAHLNPVDPPMKQLVGNLMSGGGRVLVCPPCAKVRGYDQADLVDGVVVAGAPAMLEIVKDGGFGPDGPRRAERYIGIVRAGSRAGHQSGSGAAGF